MGCLDEACGREWLWLLNRRGLLGDRRARSLFQIYPDPPNLLDEWLELCRTHEVSGKNAHDARLAAYARLNNIKTLVTFNPRDFARYGFTVMVP